MGRVHFIGGSPQARDCGVKAKREGLCQDHYLFLETEWGWL